MYLVIYLFKKILPIFLGALFFFSLVLNLVDLFMNIATYLQNSAPPLQIIQVMLYYIPKTLWYAVPVAFLFSTSYVLSDMYAHNELEALFASGVSLLKFTMPVLIVSFLMSFVLFIFENAVVVQNYEKKISLQDVLLNKAAEKENNKDVIVLSENGKIIYKADRYNEENKRLENCTFVFRDENKVLDAVIISTGAFWNEEQNHWILQNAVEYSFDSETRSLKKRGIENEKLLQLTESYEIFRNSDVDIQSVNSKTARQYIKHLKKAGLPYSKELSEYYKKFAFPLIVFIVVFLSIGLTGKTKKNVLLISLASCITASVLFYVTMMVTMVFAKHGYISPFMGAWSPVILFTILSAFLLKYSRT